MSDRNTPETDAVWADKSRNILEHARNLERQRDEVRKERDALLAREIPKDPTPDGLLYRYRNDRLFHELVDQLALSKFLPERDRLCAERDTAKQHMDLARAEAACPDDETLVMHCRELRAALDAEQAARKALVAALLICIRYADSSADTEQAHAALALAAKLP